MVEETVEQGKNTRILIEIVDERVVVKISGERLDLVNALSTLMTDENKNQDTFRNLMEEALSYAMLEKFTQNRSTAEHSLQEPPIKEKLPN